MRMRMQTAVIENGFVYCPKMSPGCRTTARIDDVSEGRHDDQVDSTSQALQWFNWQPPEPSIITYYRRLNEELHGRDENSIVTMKCDRGNPTVCTLENGNILPDKDGLYRMCWKDAKPLLRTIGWHLVKDAR
jgi:hypothetical protein